MSNGLHTISVAVLMGGQSTRMGQDKGLMEYKGKPMIKHVLDEVSNFSDDVFIVGNNIGYEQFGYRICMDIPVGKGPLKGILTALYQAKYSRVLMLGCDMPHYSTNVVKMMLEGNDEDKCLIPKWSDEYQPLGGVYHKNAYQHMLSQLKQGTYKITDALEGMPWKAIDMTHIPLSENSFLNMNTMKDINQQK